MPLSFLQPRVDRLGSDGRMEVVMEAGTLGRLRPPVLLLGRDLCSYALFDPGALPRGQRYAGMAMGFTTFQYYRYVLLPMAFRIIIPPLTSETMNIFKNSSVAFAVSVSELTMFAMQAQEETSRGIEVYLAVTGLYIISAFAINRIMAFIEKRARIPGFVVAGGAGGH